jgi:abhydrolase domain-containing protein 8
LSTGDVAFHRRIAVPTLLVYGLKDGFVSLVEMCEMERTIPKAYLELIPLSGHHVMQDQPKELNAMIKKFVEKYQPSSGAKS